MTAEADRYVAAKMLEAIRTEALKPLRDYESASEIGGALGSGEPAGEELHAGDYQPLGSPRTGAAPRAIGRVAEGPERQS